MGFLGPGPIQGHLAHARTYVRAWDGPPPPSAADLGSGGGVPSLPLALEWADSQWALVEASGRRARFLARATRELGLEDRVEIWHGRAEALAQDPERRGRRDLVTARGFAPPAVTAECGAPFLTTGGRLLVSEPPEGRVWPERELELLGLRFDGRRDGVAILTQVQLCPPTFPRRAPLKDPLF